MKSLFLAFLTFFIVISSNFAQTNKKLNSKQSLNSGTIENQFDFLINKSNKWQEYKVVKYNWLLQLKSHVSDSLNEVKKELVEANNSITSHQQQIDSLRQSLQNTQNKLEQTTLEKEQFQFMGIATSKSFFRILFLIIIVGLSLFLIMFIYRFKNSNQVAKNTLESLKEVEEEFDQHRKRALEREQKVMRRLQDELNKQKKKD